MAWAIIHPCTQHFLTELLLSPLFDSITLKKIFLTVHLNFNRKLSRVIASKRIGVFWACKRMCGSADMELKRLCGVTLGLSFSEGSLALAQPGPDPCHEGFLTIKVFKSFPSYGPQPNTFPCRHDWLGLSLIQGWWR